MSDEIEVKDGEEVELEAPAGEAASTAPEAPLEPEAPAAPAAPAAPDPVAELRAQLDAVMARATRAEGEGARLRAEAESASQRLIESQSDAITNAISAEQRALEGAKRAMAQAMSEGDFDKAAEAQANIATSAARMTQWESLKADLVERTNATRAPVREAPPPPSDPIERYISQFSPRSQSWLRNHSEFVKDEKKNARLMGAHHFAVSDGFVPDSDAYFEAVERALGLKGEASAPSAPVKRSGAPPSAPPSREAPSMSGKSPTRVSLSRDELELAQSLGLTREEFAKQKLEIARERAGG